MKLRRKTLASWTMNQGTRIVLLGLYQDVYSCIGVFNFSNFAVSNYFVDINLLGD